MPQNSVINEELALSRMGGDKRLLGQLAEFFLVDAPSLLDELDAALLARNADGVRHAAHSLKGLGANFEALDLVGTARQVEALSQHGDLAGCQSLAPQLHEEHDQVIEALQDMLQQNGLPRD